MIPILLMTRTLHQSVTHLLIDIQILPYILGFDTNVDFAAFCVNDVLALQEKQWAL
jgi:hypothetical protein